MTAKQLLLLKLGITERAQRHGFAAWFALVVRTERAAAVALWRLA